MYIFLEPWHARAAAARVQVRQSRGWPITSWTPIVELRSARRARSYVDARLLARRRWLLAAITGYVHIHVGDARERRTHHTIHFVHRTSKLWSGESGHGPDLRRHNHLVRAGVDRL